MVEDATMKIGDAAVTRLTRPSALSGWRGCRRRLGLSASSKADASGPRREPQRRQASKCSGKAPGRFWPMAVTAVANAVGLVAASLQSCSLTPIGRPAAKRRGFNAGEAAQQTIALTERAADLASVFNVDVSTALEAINSGLKGEADPLEQFGIGLSAANLQAFALSQGIHGATSPTLTMRRRRNCVLP